MGNSVSRAFLLEGNLAATSAFPDGDGITAADGRLKYVYRFFADGSHKKISTLRAYRRIRKDRAGGGAGCTALCGAAQRIYSTDADFTEKGFTDLYADTGTNYGVITDAGSASVGGKRYFYAAFAKEACLFDLCGSRVATVYSAPEGAFLTDFLPVTADYFAAAYEKRGMRFVYVNENGKEKTAAVPAGLSLRMISAGDD